MVPVIPATRGRVFVDRKTCCHDHVTAILETVLSLGGVAVLLLPVVLLLERTHRRTRPRTDATSRVTAPDDADRRRVADERRAADAARSAGTWSGPHPGRGADRLAGAVSAGR